MSTLSLACDLGALADRTASDTNFAQQLVELLADPGCSPETWHVCRASSEVAPTSCRLLAIDVEMIERRSDAVRLPISASVVLRDLDSDDRTERVVFDGLLDPSIVDPSWSDADSSAAFDFKEKITGVDRAALLAAREAGTLTPLRQLQALISDTLHECTFLVGHNLPSDLKALRLRPNAIRRRLLDTQALYPTEVGGKARLKALVKAFLWPIDAERWAGFQETSHAPADDASAALLLVARELQLCGANPTRPLCAEDASGRPRAAAEPMVETRWRVAEEHIGRLLGKQGATINQLREASGAGITLASKGPGASPAPRCLTIRGPEAAVEKAVRLALAAVPGGLVRVAG